jgi:uncharacterized protein YciI
VLFVVLALLAACSAAPFPAPAYTLVQLKTGTRTGLSADERREVFAGHFANMERLAREGRLLLAGPYGQQRSDPALRGIFVLATADAATARAWAETDPAYLANVFRLEYSPLATNAALRAQLAADLAAQAAIKASGRTPAPGEGGRGYVLLTADDGEAAARALATHPAVLLLGQLDGRRAFVVLDAKNLDAATQLLAPVAPQLGTFTLDEWFATGLLVDLPLRVAAS